MMDGIRNAEFTSDGRIDCEVEHPVYGWIPYTASGSDSESIGRAIFAAAESLKPAAYVPPIEDPKADLVEWRARQRVSALQAKAALYGAGLLPSVEAMITGADFMTQLAWSDATEFRRNSPLIVALSAGLSITDADLDDLFRAAALIEF